jgi:hypothetical protein
VKGEIEKREKMRVHVGSRAREIGHLPTEIFKYGNRERRAY